MSLVWFSELQQHCSLSSQKAPTHIPFFKFDIHFAVISINPPVKPVQIATRNTQNQPENLILNILFVLSLYSKLKGKNSYES